MDSKALVDQIIKEEVETKPPEKVELAEAVTDYLESFKGINEQLYFLLQLEQETAYKTAYDSYLGGVEAKGAFAGIEEAERAYLAGETKKKPNREAMEEAIVKKAEAKGEEARKRASPNSALKVAIFLKKYIRFVRVKTAVKNQEAPLYYYHPDLGCYVEDNELLKDLMTTLWPACTKNQALDVLYKLAHKSPLKEMANHYTAWGNLLYNAKTGEFENFTPSVIVTRKIAVNYQLEAKHPPLKGWHVVDWLRGLFDGDEELFDLAIQMIKACLTGQPLEKLFWLYGAGGTGKGTLQQLIINLVGMDNIASLKITDLAGTKASRFTTSMLLGKSVVIGDDVQKDAVVKDTSELFSLTTGDIMTIEEKGKQPYALRLQMSVIQSSNGLPIMDGDRDAIDRRLRILPFTSAFKGKPNPAIKKNYINRREVLEYLAKFAVETPTRDVYPEVSKRLLEEHQQDLNPVLAFVPNLFHNDLESSFLPNSFVYTAFRDFLSFYNYSDNKKENAIHREIKNNLPRGFTVGQKVIPAGRNHHTGFFPKEDRPHFMRLPYTNGREAPERAKRPKNERGYFTPRQ